MATWPSGLLTTAKTSAGSAGMMRWTSNRSSFAMANPATAASAAREAGPESAHPASGGAPAS